MTTTVIEIVAKVSDQTSSGTASALKSLNQLEQATLNLQKGLSGVKSVSNLNLKASISDLATPTLSGIDGLGESLSKKTWSPKTKLNDLASSGLSKIIGLGKLIDGKIWSGAVTLKDFASSKIQSVLNMVKNPIVQTITLMGVTTSAVSVISTYADYDQTMANTKAVTGASEEEMSLISAETRRVAGDSTFSGTEVGGVTTILGTAGWTADQIIGGVEGVVTLAEAGDVDTTTAAGITASTIAQFGLTADDSGYVADVIASATSNSNTDISGVGETFKYVGSTASALGFSVEDLAIATGLLGDMAVEGSQAGTSLRTVFTNLVDPTTDEAAAMEKLGVSLTDQGGNMNSLMDIMLQMRSGFSSLSESEKAMYAATMGGTEALSAMFAIIDADEEKFENLTNAVYDFEGAAQQMADTRVDSLSGDFASLVSKVEEVKISIGERLSPTLRSFVQMATDYVPQIGEAIDSVLENSQMRFTALVETPQWESASLIEKVTLTWGAMVGDPISEWWDDTGYDSVITLAGNAGNTLASVLSGGLMTLLGVDLGETTNEGLQIGKAFVAGFMEGFDLNGVAEGLFQAFTSVASEAAKILPGGDSATASSWLAAGAMTYGGVKVASGVKSTLDGASALIGAGKPVASVGSAASATVGTGAAVGNLALSSAKIAAPVTIALDAVSGASNAQEWTGSNSVNNTLISAGAAAIGGTGDGVLQGSFWENALDVASNTLKGAAVGATVGAAGWNPLTVAGGAVAGGVTGLATSLVGGENIASFLTGNKESSTVGESSGEVSAITTTGTLEKLGKIEDNISEIDFRVEDVSTGIDNSIVEGTDKASEAISEGIGEIIDENIPEYLDNLWEDTMEVMDEMISNTAEELEESLSTFFGEVIPESMENLWLGTEEVMEETLLQAQEELGEGISAFLGESIPQAMDDLWLYGEETMLSTLLTATSTIQQGIIKFFGTTIPTSVQSVWDSASSSLSASSSSASSAVSKSASSFFYSASASISSFFQSATSSLSFASVTASGTTSLPAFAEGGFLDSPQLALVGEDGPEAIIPLGEKRRSRGIALWEEAGKQLGVKAYANGGIVGQVVPPITTSGSHSSGGQVSVTIGNINFQVQVPEGTHSEKDILAILKESIGDLTEEIAVELSKRLGQSFSNMPILT